MKIIGHKKQVDFLNKSLKNNSTAQAYIYSGPRGVGKFLIANKFASAVCSGGYDLKKVQGGNPENVIVVEPRVEEKKGVVRVRDISIDDIRDAQKRLSMFPSNSKFNVLLINDAERLNKSSQNALLKILEEPNSTSIIILVTAEESNILPTIKSRCQVLRFGLISLQDMKVDLVDIIQRPDLDNLLLLSMGRPGLVFEMNNDALILERRQNDYKDFRNIFSMELYDRLNKAEEMSKDIINAVSKLESWIWFLRIQGYKSLNSDLRVKSVYAAIERVENCLDKIKKTNANSRLVFENLLINL